MKLPRLNRFSVLLIAQGAVLAGVIVWGILSYGAAKAEHDRFFLPDHCPNGHDTLDMVKVSYGLHPPDSLPLVDGDHVLTVNGGCAVSVDSPAFILRCSTCGWTQDGWSYATLKEALADRPDLAHLAEP